MSNYNHPLKSTGIRILEDWGLMLVDEVPVSSGLFSPDEPLFMSWITLKGTINGALSIVAQKHFMKTLAANLLGLKEGDEPSEEEACDALKEMGNVLAGNFVTEAFGADAVFDLINPHVNEIPFADIVKFSERKVIFGFLADDQPVAITYSIKD